MADEEISVRTCRFSGLLSCSFPVLCDASLDPLLRIGELYSKAPRAGQRRV